MAEENERKHDKHVVGESHKLYAIVQWDTENVASKFSKMSAAMDAATRHPDSIETWITRMLPVYEAYNAWVDAEYDLVVSQKTHQDYLKGYGKYSGVVLK